MQETEKSTTTDTARDKLWRAARGVVERLRRGRADERGLTTLEWLLIVAAVAGLAALAVVLVQNVVDDTAEQIGGSSARGTAARVAAERVTRDARAALPTATQVGAVDTAVKSAALAPAPDTANAAVAAIVEAQTAANQQFASACDRLEINYGDIPGFSSSWEPVTVAVPTVIAAGNWIDSAASGTQQDRDQAANAAESGDAFAEAKCTVSITEG